MKIEFERKIKFWLSIIVKILIIILIVYKLITFVKGEKNNKDTNKIKLDTLIKKRTELDSNKFNKPLKIDSIHSFSKTKKEIVKKFKIREILRYKGRILKNAYFKIGNCNTCTSTITGIDGIANLDVPLKIIKNDIVRDFYIYTADTLVYHKAMRISNLQFNKY